MKKLTALLMMFAMVASMSIFAQEVAAPETAPEVEPESEKCALIPSVALSLDVKSKYMCDGEVVNPDGMLFLDAFAAWDCGLYIDLWTAIDLNGYNNGTDYDDGNFKNDRRNRPEEIDYVIGYAYTFEDLLPFSPLTFDVAYKYFQYPRAKFRSDEQVDTTVKLNNLLDKEGDAWLSTSFTWRYRTNRFDNESSNYSWIDVTYGYNFTEKFSAFLSNKVFYMCKSKVRDAGLDYNDYGKGYKKYCGNRDCFSSLESTLEADYAITKNFSVRAYVDCGWALDNEVRQAWQDRDHANSFNVRYGAGCTYAF